MRRDDSPCRVCTNRSAICHAQCVAYHEWATARRKKLDDAIARGKGNRDANERLIDSRVKNRRRKNL